MTATFRTSNPVSAADSRRPHLILVGLPGAGKSTVGRGVAERLARTFLDFDLEIERRQGKTIAEIFGEKGEGHFRQLERALTEELRLMGNMILAPGGGWVSSPEVVGMLRPPGRLIYLVLGQRRRFSALARNEARGRYSCAPIRSASFDGCSTRERRHTSPPTTLSRRNFLTSKRLSREFHLSRLALVEPASDGCERE